MTGRYFVLGVKSKLLRGQRLEGSPGSSGTNDRLRGPAAHLHALGPGRQQMLYQTFRSDEMTARVPDPRKGGKHHIIWAQRPGLAAKPFHASYQFACSLPPAGAPSHATILGRMLYTAPTGDQNLQSEPRLESDSSEITDLARNLTGASKSHGPIRRLFSLRISRNCQRAHHPRRRPKCRRMLHAGAADAGGKSRLLSALARNRGIPARLVTGLTLRQGHEQAPHVWVEAWMNNHWVPACTVYHRLGPGAGFLRRVRARRHAAGSRQTGERRRLSLFGRESSFEEAAADSSRIKDG